MDEEPVLKPVIWVGSSREDLRGFPDPVQDHIGYALYLAQRGGKHAAAKVLSGFGSAGVLEVVKDFRGDTFRAVYTLFVMQEPFMCFTHFRRSRSRAARLRAVTWN